MNKLIISLKNKTMDTMLDNLFTDVRNAFRLLHEYQERIINIVDYIMKQAEYSSMYGRRWYFNPIKYKQSEYAKLNIYSDMWGWDFLYGYIFEYYFGYRFIDKKSIDMSIFQISDDGYFTSNIPHKKMINVNSFSPTPESNSYLIFNVTVKNKESENDMWLSDKPYPNNTQTGELELKWKNFLTDFLSSSELEKIEKGSNGEFTILKKYKMQNFNTEESANNIIRDFANILNKETGIKLFKPEFYI